MPQEDVEETTEEFDQIAQNVDGSSPQCQDQDKLSRSGREPSKRCPLDEESYHKEPEEISSSHLQDDSNNECTEIEVPVCDKSQNESSVQYVHSQSKENISHYTSRNRDDAMAEMYYQ